MYFIRILARWDVAFSSLYFQKIIKVLLAVNFCLEAKHSLMGWLSFVTKMAEQMRCGDSILAYHFRMHKAGSSGEGIMGKKQEESRNRLETHQSCQARLCLTQTVCGRQGHTRILMRLHAPLPASPLPLTLFRVPGLSVAERAVCRACHVHMVSFLWKLLTGGTLELSLFVPQTAYFCWFFPPKLNHSCP